MELAKLFEPPSNYPNLPRKVHLNLIFSVRSVVFFVLHHICGDDGHCQRFLEEEPPGTSIIVAASLNVVDEFFLRLERFAELALNRERVAEGALMDFRSIVLLLQFFEAFFGLGQRF